MNLYFQDRFGHYRLVSDNVSKDSVFKAMTDYVHKLNPDFVIYYIRSWAKDGEIHYDVGSHSEFFLLTEGVFYDAN